MKLLGYGISSLKNNSTLKMQFATIYRNHKEMKIHQSHPLYKIARKEELNRLQHIEEFSKVQSIAEEIAIKEIRGEDEATLSLLEQLQKEEDEENRREAEMAARRRNPRTRSQKKEVKRKILQEEDVTIEEEVTGTQDGEPTSLPDYSHLECPTPLNSIPMDEYLDPKVHCSSRSSFNKHKDGRGVTDEREKGRRLQPIWSSWFHLKIEKVISINARAGTKRLPERLAFEMEDGRRVVWPVYTVLIQDYKTLVMVYNKINKKPVLGRHLANEVQQQICKIRRDKAVDDDLPTRMIVPNSTGKKIHFEPFYMMEFRDETGQRRFFRMRIT